jgi:hypothetical protein
MGIVIFLKNYKGERLMKYTHVLPFMGKEELKEAAFDIINGKLEGVKLEKLYPFLGRETLDEVVDLLIERKERSKLIRAIPFMSKQKIQRLYEAAEKGEIPNFDTTILLPFLETDKIKEIFKNLVQKASDEVDEDDDDDDEDEIED